jgi:hypothetical protein
MFGDVDMYYVYTFVAPIYFGIMGMIAMIIKDYSGWSIQRTFAVMGIVSALTVSYIISRCNLYSFTKNRYYMQYIYLIMYHLFTFILMGLLIYYID